MIDQNQYKIYHIFCLILITMQIKEQQRRDSIRIVWNVMPNTRTLLAKVSIPQALHYTPLHNESPNTLSYRPMQCFHCRAYMNPYNRIETYQSKFTCCICKNINKLPANYLQDKNNLPREINLDYSSFITTSKLSQSIKKIGFIFVLDTCLPQPQLNSIKQEIKGLISHMDDDYRVGLITYNKVVNLYNFSRKISHVQMFSSDYQYSTVQFGQILGFNEIQNSYLSKLKDCRGKFIDKLQSINKVKAQSYKNKRQLRATGQALNLALSLNELSTQVSRILFFCGGICTVGIGKVISQDYKEEIRSIGEQPSKQSKEASQFYKKLTAKVMSKLTPIDSFIFNVESVGLTQMMDLLTATGGLLVQHEEFNSNIFSQSFKKAYIGLHEYPPLETAFFSQMIISKSEEINIHSINNRQIQSKNQLIVAIPLGCINQFSTITVHYDLSQLQTTSEAYYMQLKTQYYYPENINIKFQRVTTIRRLFGSFIGDINQGFDQEAALAAVAKLTIRKSLSCTSEELLLWLDNMLCRFSSVVGQYRKNDSESFKLSENMKNIPQFIYYLRKSSIVRKRGISLDEYNYINYIINSQSISNIITIIQPAMLEYTLEHPTRKAVALDERHMKSQTILLLDSFFNIVEWRGKGIESLYNQSQLQGFENPGNEIFNTSSSDICSIKYDRFPIPHYYLTGVDHSKQRFIKSKLGYRNNDQSQTNLSDQADIVTFTNKLIDLIVNKNV